MKICVAQTRAIKGDIQKNIEKHQKLIHLALSKGVELIVFPELSLTGYEPSLAKELATHPDDERFNTFQEISDLHQITIGVGIPTKNEGGVCITMVLFQPNKARKTYSKQYLHPDEEPFFVSGQNLTGLKINETPVSFAICYELSMPQHSENAFNSGAEIYIASVAKSASGVQKAAQTLAEIASKYSMTVLMSNALGPSDDFESVGKTAIWNKKGVLVGQLDDTHEGILLIDTDTQVVTSELA